ncbi:hypothetical protein [Arsenicicoccus dermatophilus]|uniref:hypothetical protein n=1 Tax=Arsenicicoccus dermatophilus TaxID=1076331 RepID=UPI001F4CB793|nr:hypothetical protein [Arsenicicoccus dermatophilus]MCH8614193.1 hypothetical protein [Arsenicicoccus dermatophilus]
MSEQVSSSSMPTRLVLARRHLVMVPITALLAANAAHQARSRADLWWWATLAVLLTALVVSWWVWWRERAAALRGEAPRASLRPQPMLLVGLVIAGTLLWTLVLSSDQGAVGLVGGIPMLAAAFALAWDQHAAARRYAEELASRGSLTRAPDHQG